jgi:serine/threonine-protein kinase
VVQVLDYGVHRELPYIVMELLPGEDLYTRLKRVRRLRLSQTAALLNQACKALQLVHEAGLIHRDIKPSNIFLTKSGGEEIVKLIDFGLIKRTRGPPNREGCTEAGVVLGTAQYMSPEQARASNNVDHRSDLWSIAAVAYRTITGHKLVDTDDFVEILMAVAVAHIRPPSSLLPELPPAVDRFFEKALARNPDDRFQSAAEFASAFAIVARATDSSASGDSRGQDAPTAPDDRPSGGGWHETDSHDRTEVETARTSMQELITHESQLPRSRPHRATIDDEIWARASARADARRRRARLAKGVTLAVCSLAVVAFTLARRSERAAHGATPLAEPAIRASASGGADLSGEPTSMFMSSTPTTGAGESVQDAPPLAPTPAATSDRGKEPEAATRLHGRHPRPPLDASEQPARAAVVPPSASTAARSDATE